MGTNTVTTWWCADAAAAAPSASPWVGALFLLVGCGFAIWYTVRDVRRTVRKATLTTASASRLTTSRRLRLLATATPAATIALFFGIGAVMVFTGSKLVAWLMVWAVFGALILGALLWLASIVVAQAEHVRGNRQRAALGQVRRRALLQPRTAAAWMFLGTFVVWLGSLFLTAYLLYLRNPIYNSNRYNHAFWIVSGINLASAAAVISWVYRRQKHKLANEERRIREADLKLAGEPPDPEMSDADGSETAN